MHSLTRILLPLAILAVTGCVAPNDDDSAEPTPAPGPLRLDEVQARCTHNSYHVAPSSPVVDEHRYTHAPLAAQLGEQGVRGFELDIHLDDADRLVVFHIPVIDQQTTCETFVECLQGIEGWSAANPQHHPIFVWMELKDDIDANKITNYDQIDAEIRSVFPPERLLEPDEVQGSYDSLREALTEEGWPLIDTVRGQTMFLLLEGEEHGGAYSDGYTSLAGKPIFVQTDASRFDTPIAAVAKINDAGSADIAGAVQRRILVASNIGAADNSDEDNEAKRQVALASGSNMLCDDFPAAVQGQEYWLDMPDGTPTRCNPLRASAECTAEGLESLP